MNPEILIDSHCHLDEDYLPKSAADLVREAKQNHVDALVTIGTDLRSLDRVQQISAEFLNVYHTVGVHPQEAGRPDAIDWDRVERAAKNPKCRAIGEIGLDYHYENTPPALQMEYLDRQLDLALKLKLPVVIHSREAEEDLLSCLKKYCSKTTGIPGVIHCFSGSLEFGKACVDLGFYISFSGILTFKKADSVREAARALPLQRLLVETDAPYLAPVPFRGKKCEPSMLKHTALALAQEKGVSLGEVAAQTTANSMKLFQIDAPL